MTAGYVDLEVQFPDPVTGRGMIVNTLTFEVFSELGVLLDTFTLSSGIESVSTLLDGVYYVYPNYSVMDPAKTPGTSLTLRYTATKGTGTIGPIDTAISFRPVAQGPTTGVLIAWKPDALLTYPSEEVPKRVLFYEVRRHDLRLPNEDGSNKKQYVPGDYNVAYWSFDDTLDDGGAGPVNLTGVGNVIYQRSQINNGVLLNGATYLEAANPGKLSFGANQDFSISVWVQPSMRHAGGFVVGKMRGTNEKGYGLFVDRVGTKLYPSLYIGDGTVNIYGQSLKDVADGLLHHLALSVDRDGDAVLYVDNVEVNRQDVSFLAGAAFDLFDFRVGAANGATPRYFIGNVDELIFFSGALQPHDVDRLYTEQTGVPVEEVVGRTSFFQMLDTNILSPLDMRNYVWRVYEAVQTPNGTDGDYTFSQKLQLKFNQVQFSGAPLCFVEGRVKRPDDIIQTDDYVKFYACVHDRGLFFHDRYIGDEEVIAFPNQDGQFGAYLIQDAVITCHMPSAHLALRFAVPRKAYAKLDEIETRRVRLRNNL